MRVLVDARIISGKSGGVEQAIIGLANSYKENPDLGIQCTWLVYSEHLNWLKPHISANDKFLVINLPKRIPSAFDSLTSKFRSSLLGDFVLSILRKVGPFRFRIPSEPKVVISENPDLIHFALQFGFKTNRPNIYQPHDLQHLHLPELFSKEQRVIRDIGYRDMAEQATLIVVGNEWTKQDIASKMKYPSERIFNVPVAMQPFSLTSLKKQKLKLDSPPTPYALYPAAGWRHKNHINLLRAFKLLHSRGTNLYLVLTGNDLYNSNISNEVSTLDLEKYVTRLGFIEDFNLAKLYVGAAVVVVPTLFESASFPIWEAFKFGTPVIASDITSLPAQMGPAAALFDPLDPESIALAIEKSLNAGVEVRAKVDFGRERVQLLSFGNTAKGYRFAYRRALNLEIDSLDKTWVSEGFRF